ncbi:hypothetical protein GCM10011611_05910 [Aliidongia dinghuensis]|uniref:DUF2157 domain-containing protein n=1 Tax=Aliidongia dinghuensis TaxID=1867774 RepID=A0A8J2YQQ8_9PROT|nr:hypothetical protein [Aliidongia dinghuensis]GGF03190.1 hypothetical protein GCM10011611_05910 [Aliidongia dinghuensis]
MYSDEDLDAAVAAGVLRSADVAGFRAFTAERRSEGAVDEEQFRLLTGFNDIFVSVAILLLLGAAGWLGSGISPAVGGGIVAGLSWALAEYFTRRRRMALPSIVLLLGFAVGLFGLGAGSFHGFAAGGLPGPTVELPFAAGAALAAVGTYLHWRRFMVPITVAAGVAAAIGTLLLTVMALVPAVSGHWPLLLLAGGLAVFAFAMAWDASDRTRSTRRADVAFWLHLSAAPMIVHPIFSMLGLLGQGDTDLVRAGAAIAIYLLLALVALAVDRRALLVSALFYVLYAMSALFRAAGSLSASFALTALVIGSALLLLSALWHRARAGVLAALPPGLRARLPVV